MRYIKEYNSNGIQVNADYYWIIYGNRNTVAYTIAKFYESLPNEQFYRKAIRSLKQIFSTFNGNKPLCHPWYDNIKGTFITFTRDGGMSYFAFDNDKEKEKYIYDGKFEDFQGELKVDENDKLVLDDLEISIRKYNL